MREDFRRVVMGDGKPQDEDALGELTLLEGVQKFPQRVKCAMLGWRALEQALEGR
jgi:nitrogen fixation NifU-like protein